MNLVVKQSGCVRPERVGTDGERGLMAAPLSGGEFKKLCLMVLKPTGFMLAPLYSNIIN